MKQASAERTEADAKLRYELVDGRHGRFLANPKDRFIGRALIEHGEFSELEAKLLLQLVPSGGTVVEVGANIGAHTVSLAKAVGPSGRVHAFEPQPIAFQNLCANLALNNLTNVRTYNCGCGSERAEIMFPDIDYAVEGNYGAVALDRLAESDDGMRIEILPLDAYGLECCDVLKIDAEGMELDVLLGAAELIASLQPILYLENDRVLKSSQVISHIRSLDYRLWWHLPPYFNPDNWRGNGDNPWPDMVSYNMLCLPKSRKPLFSNLEEIVSPSHRPLRMIKR